MTSSELKTVWMNTLPSQFRPERIIKQDLSFYIVDEVADLEGLPKTISNGSVAFVLLPMPCMYMKGTFSWVPQTTSTRGDL